MPQHTLFFYLPCTLGVITSLSLLMALDFDALSICIALFMLLAGVAVGWWLDQHAAELKKTSSVPSRSRMEQSCDRALPIWSKQIETVRGQTQVSVVALCKLFSQIVRNLEAALANSKQTAGGLAARGDGGILAVITECQTELNKVMTILEATQRSRLDLMSEVSGLAKFAQDLQAMSEEVTNIALQSNVVALNATIEAARAGEHGKSFAIVVGEMRNLSNLSRTVGDNMSKKVRVISTEVLDRLESAKQMSEADTQSGHDAKVSVDSVLARFREASSRLSESITVLQSESDVIHDQISDALVSLQYQDRVSQILTHVTDNMDEMHRFLRSNQSDVQDANVQPTVAADDPLHKLTNTYSTEEEHQNHEQAKARWAQASGVTYF